MSNKTQLQQHNDDLAAALDNLNGLPMVEDVKHGKYVWEKYKHTPPVVIKNMTMTITQTYAEIIISNPSFSLPETDYMFFDSFGNSEGFASPRFYKEGGKLKFETRSGSKVDVSSYSKGDCKITLGSSGNTSDNGTYSMICHEKIMENAKKEFIEHLVSDNPDKYPDDGEWNDFHYKKTERIPYIFGYENVDYGSFIPSVSTGSAILSHKLKLTPKMLILYTETDFKKLMGGDYTCTPIKILTYSENMYSSSYGAAVIYYNAYNQGYETSSHSGFAVSWNNTTIRMSMPSSGIVAIFYQGQKYQWIALA